jgi:hypothetical protein
VNRKTILSLLGVAAVVVAAALVWAITHAPSPLAPAPTSTPVARMPAKPRTTPALQAVAPPAAPASAVVSEPAPAPPQKSDFSVLAVTDPDTFVKGLSTEQNRKLAQLLSKKFGDHITESQKYQLDADLTLTLLDRNPKLALNDAQKQMLSDVKAVYRTKMDAALGDKFAQVDEIGRKMTEIYANAKSQSEAGWDSQELRYKQFEIMGAIHEAKAAFDTDYETSVRACLTPDQIQAFDNFNQRRAASAAALNQLGNLIQKATP